MSNDTAKTTDGYANLETNSVRAPVARAVAGAGQRGVAAPGVIRLGFTATDDLWK